MELKRRIILILLGVVIILAFPVGKRETNSPITDKINTTLNTTESIISLQVQADTLSEKQNKLQALQRESSLAKNTNYKDSLEEKIYESDILLYTSEEVNLLKEPNDSAEVIKTLEKGEEVRITGLTENKYCRCEINNEVGYIPSSYLDKQEIEITATGNKGDYQRYAWSLFDSYGWTVEDFNCLVTLWNHESGWNPSAHNPSSGAHGIPQSLPASKMASEGADYYTNAETQIRWGLKYIYNRYGSPSAAWKYWQSHNWY